MVDETKSDIEILMNFVPEMLEKLEDATSIFYSSTEGLHSSDMDWDAKNTIDEIDEWARKARITIEAMGMKTRIKK